MLNSFYSFNNTTFLRNIISAKLKPLWPACRPRVCKQLCRTTLTNENSIVTADIQRLKFNAQVVMYFPLVIGRAVAVPIFVTMRKHSDQITEHYTLHLTVPPSATKCKHCPDKLESPLPTEQLPITKCKFEMAGLCNSNVPCVLRIRFAWTGHCQHTK